MGCGIGARVFCDILNISKSFKLSNDCSVFHAEIFAIKKDIDILANCGKCEVNGPVTIEVDSQGALKALNSNHIPICLLSLTQYQQ